MSEKKNPPMPPRSEEEVVFGDELPVLPIRNAVLFPGAVAPFDVGREKSVALVEDVDNLPGPRHRHLRPARSLHGRPGRGGPLPRRLRRARPQGPQAQLGQLLADPPGADAHPARVRHRQRPLPQGQGPPARRAPERGRRGRGPGDEPARHRQAGHPAHARAPARGGLPHRLHPGPRRPGRSRRRQPRRPRRGEGHADRDHRGQGAHPQGAPPAHPAARDPQDARAHQLPDQGGDGQEPARVRAPPAAQGHQGGAGRGRGRPERPRRPRGSHRQGQPPHRGRDGRQEAAQAPAHHAGRLGRVHRRPHLPRLDHGHPVEQVARRTTSTSPPCARSSTRTTTASRR